MSFIRMSLAAVLGIGMIAACSDRFGDMKSRKYTQEDYLKARKMTVEQYNEWARANNKPLIQTRPQIPPNQPKNPDQPLRPLNPDPLPDPKKPGAGPGLSSGAQPLPEPGPGLSSGPQPPDQPNPAPGLSSGTQPPDQPGADNCGQPPAVEAAYSKKFWSCEFQRVMKLGENTSLPLLIKGLTIGSGKAGDKAVFSVQAVVMFGEDMRILTTDSIPVEFDQNEVKKAKIELRAKAGGPVDTRLTDEIFLSASCLSNETPCREFGLILDFKVEDGRLLGVFQVQTGANSNGEPSTTGVAASNVQNLQAFVKGQAELPPEQPGDVTGGTKPPTQTPGTVNPGGETPFQTAPQALRAAQAITSKMVEHNAAALAAKNAAVAAGTAGAECDKDKAKAEADKAEAAVKSVEEAMPMLQSVVDQLKALLNTQKEKDAADAMVTSSRTLLESTKTAAADARAAADKAEQNCAAAAPGVSGGPRLNGTPDPEGEADLMTREAEERRRSETAPPNSHPDGM